MQRHRGVGHMGAEYSQSLWDFASTITLRSRAMIITLRLRYAATARSLPSCRTTYKKKIRIQEQRYFGVPGTPT